MHRPPDTRWLLEALLAAFEEATAHDPPRRALVGRLVESLGRSRRTRSVTIAHLAVLRHLDEAIALVERRVAETPGADAASGRASADAMAAVARAVASLAPSLAWYRRRDDEAGDEGFRDAHANAYVIGPDGLEDGPGGAAVGISLMAPGIRYPDHHHPPEELYLVLSPGRWRHGDSGWFEPGVGGVVHNTPDIVHAMHSDEAPLLAIWCLLPDSGQT